MKRQDKIVIDMSGILDAETMHEYLSKKLNFSGNYGFNLDAFWDFITDDEQSSMPSALYVEGLESLEKCIPEEYFKFIECLNDYESQYSERKVFYFRESPSGEGIKV